MSMLPLRALGFAEDVEIRGTICDQWRGGRRLVILFGESHRDRQMKRLNVSDALALVTAEVVGCVGTEVPLCDFESLTRGSLREWSEQLFATHGSDEGVLALLAERPPHWFGTFEFADALKVLRSELPVRCVEDPRLREEMKRIADAYCTAELLELPPPFPEYPKMGDHPHNVQREQAMVESLLEFWDGVAPASAAILNAGADHCLRLARRLREHDISYFIISHPRSPDPFSGATTHFPL